MMKALYSGVSGMRSHQTKMDVIGNNIANVNTYGYKSQRTTFRDVYYQAVSNPSQGTATRGGTNSAQVGYGAKLGSIDTLHTISGYSPTNSQTDLYINGDGYFAVTTTSGDLLYTRLGAFNFDAAGNLVDPNGSIVMGWNETAAGSGTVTPAATVDAIQVANFKDYKYITINPDGTISAVNPTDQVVTIGQIAVASIPNPNALVLEGNSYFRVGNNAEYDDGTANANLIKYNVPGAAASGTGALVTGGLEMSNVDLANEFSDMIITQRGYQANTKIISVVDQMLEELVNLKR